MSVLTFLVTSCTTSIVAGTAVVTPVIYVFWDNNVIDFSEADLQDFSGYGAAKRGECWEIPITPKTSLKFLVCANQDKYYLYDFNNSDNSKIFKKIKQITGPNSKKEITITLEGEEETKNLTLASENLMGSSENLDFFQHCNKVSTDNGVSLFCTLPAPCSWNSSIELINFRVSSK